LCIILVNFEQFLQRKETGKCNLGDCILTLIFPISLLPDWGLRRPPNPSPNKMHTFLQKKSGYRLTRIILRPLSALSLDEVNIAKRNITTGLFGLGTGLLELNYSHTIASRMQPDNKGVVFLVIYIIVETIWYMISWSCSVCLLSTLLIWENLDSKTLNILESRNPTQKCLLLVNSTITGRQ
jgi:hypothetical protein